MSNNKILVAIGDSFVYGHYGDDLNHESCWQRSWVKKLERIGNFKSSINMGAPGGNNQRSFRMLMDFLSEHYDPKEEYVLIYGITELMRSELVLSHEDMKKYNMPVFTYSPYDTKYDNIYAFGAWTVGKFKALNSPRNSITDYIETYHALLIDNKYMVNNIENQMLAVHFILNNYNIKHYFTETITLPGITFNAGKKLGIELPFIKYSYNNETCIMAKLLLNHGYKVNWCGHFDHDANEFLANYIHERIA